MYVQSLRILCVLQITVNIINPNSGVASVVLPDSASLSLARERVTVIDFPPITPVLYRASLNSNGSIDIFRIRQFGTSSSLITINGVRVVTVPGGQSAESFQASGIIQS